MTNLPLSDKLYTPRILRTRRDIVRILLPIYKSRGLFPETVSKSNNRKAQRRYVAQEVFGVTMLVDQRGNDVFEARYGCLHSIRFRYGFDIFLFERCEENIMNDPPFVTDEWFEVKDSYFYVGSSVVVEEFHIVSDMSNGEYVIYP